jgi:polycomb protein EED
LADKNENIMSENQNRDENHLSIGRRKRSSAARLEDNNPGNDGSDDEIDDSLSTVTTGSVADDNSHCETPTNVNNSGSCKNRRKRLNKANSNVPAGGRCRFKYKCTNFLKEDHGQPIFGAQFNYHTRPGDPLILATVGSNRISIYECGSVGSEMSSGEMVLLQAYVDPDGEENFYTCAWTCDSVSGLPLLAAAGARGLIRLIDPSTMTCTKHFTGHGQAINELKFHPFDGDILLSVSKDHSMRLWNIKTDVCIAIFGGIDGHRDEVLSADIDISGQYIVSCGMDHSVKIWSLCKPSIISTLQLAASYLPTNHVDKTFPTEMQHYPDFSTRDIHSNYVDCVRWFGQFVLSKSCENRIVLWKPTTELSLLGTKPAAPDGATISILHQFDFQNCDIWFIRFSTDYRQKVMAAGNQIGRVYVWDIDVDDPLQVKFMILTHNKCVSAVRQTTFSRDGNILVCVCDDASVWRWDRAPS